MLKNILSTVASDYKKDVAMVTVAFVGGVALGYVLTKNGKNKIKMLLL